METKESTVVLVRVAEEFTYRCPLEGTDLLEIFAVLHPEFLVWNGSQFRMPHDHLGRNLVTLEDGYLIYRVHGAPDQERFQKVCQAFVDWLREDCDALSRVASWLFNKIWILEQKQMKEETNAKT